MLLSATHLLVLSGSCSFRPYPFNRSVVLAFQKISYSAKFCLPSQTECCPNYIIFISTLPCSIGVLPEVVLPCPSFLTECFQLHSFPLYSFFHEFVQPLKVRGFTRLSKKQLCFTFSLPLPFPSGAILDLGMRSSRSGGVL